MNDLVTIWVYLASEPLAALTVTLCAWVFAQRVASLARGHPLVNPVLVAVILLAGLLLSTGVDYATYFTGAQFVHFLLGPATVALAVPLHRQWSQVLNSPVAVVASVLCGGAFATMTGVALAYAMGAAPEVVASLAPRAVTTPVAMGIAAQIGGLPGLTAVVVICSGIVGAALGPIVLNIVGVRDWRARGIAIGTAGHGIGTARAMSVNSTAGAFSGLAMGLNALATAMWLPLAWKLWMSP